MPRIIVLVGPESSGKSRLTVELAQHYKVAYVTEFARNFLLARKGVYSLHDLDIIADAQDQAIHEAASQNKSLLICDTDSWSVYMWSKLKYNQVSSSLLPYHSPNSNFDYLLCFPDLTYEPDPLRENPILEEREFIYNAYLSELQSKANFLGLVKGSGSERLKNAINLIDSKN